MKRTKTKLVSSIVTLLICFAMLIGSTFAWFTDSASTGVNRIQAGNLDIEVKHTNSSIRTPENIEGVEKMFLNADGDVMNWEPGAVSYETFTVSNKGSLALKYNLKLNITDYNAVNGTGKTLKDVLKVKVLDNSTGNEILNDVTRDNVANLNWTNSVALDAFQYSNQSLLPNAENIFQVIVYWQPTANDNDWNVNNDKTTTDEQPLFIDFGINVVASQLQHESDSFGNDYDSGIVLPDLPVSINKKFESAPITNDLEGIDSVIIKNSSTAAEVATVPASAVNNVIRVLESQATDKLSGSETQTVLYLDVATANKTESTVTYNINMSATMTYTTSSGTNTQTLDNLDGYLADEIVTAKIEIGKGLANVSVTHDTTPMSKLTSEYSNSEGFYYNKETGILTIKSTSFSPFIVDYSLDAVAIVNGNPYSTLEEALSNSENGDTINILKDIDINIDSVSKVGYKVENKSVVINGNNHTLTFNGESQPDTYGLVFTGTDESKTITLNNVNINANRTERAIRTEGNIKVNITNCNITTNGVGIHIKGANKVQIDSSTINVNVINNDTFTAHKRSAVMVGGENADVIVSKCDINAINLNKKTDNPNDTTTWCKGLYVGSFSKNAKITANDTNVVADFSIAIDGAQYDNTPFEEKPTQIIINSGEYSGLFGSPSGFSYKSLIINGGTFTGIKNYNSFNGKDDSVAKLVISGGAFNVKPDSKFVTIHR